MTITVRACASLIATAMALGCGGRTGNSDAGDGGQNGDALADGVSGDGWTLCSAPSGAIICGGPNQCGSECPPNDCGHDLGTGAVTVCSNPSAPWGNADCQQCPDGNLCFDGLAYNFSPNGFPFYECGSPDYGVLYRENGAGEYVQYADRASYTGDPLPSPATCPSTTGLKLCGGVCGDCPNGYVCMGRSPLHPYSLCVNDKAFAMPNDVTFCNRGQTGMCNPAGTPNSGPRECLTFKVDDAAQPVADQYSLCIDSPACEAAAQSYPGGAICTP